MCVVESEGEIEISSNLSYCIILFIVHLFFLHFFTNWNRNILQSYDNIVQNKQRIHKIKNKILKRRTKNSTIQLHK